MAAWARRHSEYSIIQEEKVTSYLSVRTRDNDSIRASIMVMSGNLRNSFLRILDAPVSTRGSRNRSVSLYAKFSVILSFTVHLW